VRPYFANYPASAILGWTAERGAFGTFLSQIRLKETVTESTGRFTVDTVEQIRVLEPGSWEVWRQAKTADGEKSQWTLFESSTTSIDVIPFVFFYRLREGLGIGRPPLLELAHLNIEHWQSASDQQNILHVARVPILFAKGFGTVDKITVGAKAATTAKDAHAELKYVEHSGAAIEAGRNAIHDLEDRMRQIGAELLTERLGEVTAQQVNSEDEDNRSTLRKIVEEFEDSLESCLALMALWGGDKNADPRVELFKDFATVSPAGHTSNQREIK
jgi:hypothetical protein